MHTTRSELRNAETQWRSTKHVVLATQHYATKSLSNKGFWSRVAQWLSTP